MFKNHSSYVVSIDIFKETENQMVKDDEQKTSFFEKKKKGYKDDHNRNNLFCKFFNKEGKSVKCDKCSYLFVSFVESFCCLDS